MSASLTLLGLLGVATVAEAAQRWPRETFLPDLGLVAGGDDPDDYEPLLAYLDRVLSFRSVRPGVGHDRVGLAAEVVVAADPAPRPLVLRRLPDIGFVLLDGSPAAPARLFVTQSDAGVEVVVEGLPVEIRLPNGLLMPLRTEAEEQAGPALQDVEQGGPFVPGTLDHLRLFLSELGSSRVHVHLRVRFTEEGEVVVEPAVPIAVAACRFGGLPCRGVHDLGFLPYPTLSGAHTPDEQALEWVRHEIPLGLGFEGNGLVTVRTLDLDHSRDPLRQLLERSRRTVTGPADDDAQVADLEFVLEDLALPVSAWLTPVATHGRFGVRRAVLVDGDEIEAYDLTQAPLEVSLGPLVDWRLRVFRLLFESPSTLVARMAVLFGDSVEEDHAMVVDVSDGWLLQGAWLPPDPLHAFTVAGARVHLMTARLGVLLRDIQQAQGSGWLDHLKAVVDIGIAVGDEDEGPFTVAGPARPPGADLGMDLVLRDVGWSLGGPSLGFWLPEGIKLTAFRVLQLDLEELVFLADDNGGRYLALSGGISLFPGVGTAPKVAEPGTPGVPAEGSPNGAGLRFRRLRLRIGGNELAPRWLVDGISLFLRIGKLELSGSGMVSDTSRDGHRFQEFGLSLLLRFSAMGKDFSIGGQLFYGRVSGPADTFTYWLVGVQLAYCPAGSAELRGISVLVAGGMMPNLPAPSGRPQEMRLLEWYRQHRAAGAVEIRDDRAPQRGGWRVEQGAEAAGVGADLGLSVSRAVTLRAFLFFHRSDTASGLLVSAEVFLLKARTPVGFGAIEVDLDRDRYSALVGVDLDFAQLLDSDSALAKGLGRLTGTIFAGNQPAMFAIGQLADPASWLTFSVSKSFLGLSARLSVGFCLQISARPGPRGFGFLATASAQGPMGIGKVQFYAALGVLVGTWGNQASASGVIAWAEVALRIKVFFVFSFGASVKAAIEQLGPQEPNYRRVSLEVRIETPWWLPDVTFRVERVRHLPQPEAMPLLSAPLSGATVHEPGAAEEVPVAVTALGPAGALHTAAELRSLPSAPVPDAAFEALTPVSVDSVLALDLAASLGNETTVVPSTALDAGRQDPTPPAQNLLAASYTLLAVGVRRRPRFGAGAGVWTDLLAPEDSRVGGLGDLLGDPDVEVTFASVLRFRWDADVVADGRVDPRRLLVNADTPFSFVTANPGSEEGLLANDPGYPCCLGKREYPPHILDFTAIPLGVRVPAVQRFTHSASTLRWQLTPTPVAAPALGPTAGVHVARPVLHLSTDATLAVVAFDDPAFTVDIGLFWRPVNDVDLDSALVIEATRGLETVDRRVLPLRQPGPVAPVHLEDPRGMTGVTLRYARHADAAGGVGAPAGEWLELRRIQYRTVRETRDFLADQARCQATGRIAGGGKLAWLPHHDYELALTVRTTVEHQGNVQEAVVTQRAGFRTRGLPGLNAVAAVGQELEPYVESVYPGTTPRLLYRTEPVVLAFDERFSSLLPVDRTPSPTDPAERTQLLEWVLAVDRADGGRLSVTSPDWVTEHRGTAPPPRRGLPWVVDDLLVRARVRSAASLQAATLRLERLAARSPGCGPVTGLHSSQVLAHQPVDPEDPEAAAPRWPARTTLRLAVRQRNAPFVSRAPFEPGDETALTVADEGSPGATGWVVADGGLRVTGAPAPGRRHYAVLGEPGWAHVRVSADVDPAGGAAGVALAVAGLPRVERALLAVVDEAAGELRVLARRGGAGTLLAAAPLPAGASAPYCLEVHGFDDRLRVRLGETTVEAERGDLRDGRLAVVVDGPGACTALHVEGLEAYASQLATSRYATFEDHLASWDGVAHASPGQAGAIPGLLAATGVDIAAAMTPAADPQARQRLFDRWVAEAVLPLAGAVAGLRFAVVADDAGTRALLLESPEPVPFSRDVTIAMTHRVRGLPGPPPAGVPRSLLRFAANLVFARDTVSGAVPADVVDVVGQAAILVHSVRLGAVGRVVYRFYAVAVRTGAAGARLAGDLVEVRQVPPRRPGFPPRPMRFPVDHVGLFDSDEQPVAPLLPLPVERDETVPLTVLTNAVEDKALLAPAGPLAADTYTLALAVDRERYRAATADDDSRYRATATLQLPL